MLHNPLAAGSLLIASTHITDGCFHKSVVLLAEHSEAGSWGLILNKPTSAPVDRLCPDLDDRPDLHTKDIFYGGPVGQDSGIGLALADHRIPTTGGIHHVIGDIALVDLSHLASTRHTMRDLRIFAGYAGWSAEQLDDELDSGAWHIATALHQDIQWATPEAHWSAVLRRQGAPLSWYATYPDDPQDN